ncbi:hypothetical protein P0Y35_07680 [Kiritimatiellaeota bacterium B1221]|nr:hypothetical protein [Kiritimatiellaeota bacterium B1221]
MSLVACHPYLLGPGASFQEWGTYFCRQSALPLQQTWRTQPVPGFMPGKVWMGWEPEGFVVYAELEDRDIFNPVRELNAPAFLKGDVFEIFLKPQGADVYYELHVGPHNQLFQYRIPSSKIFYEGRKAGLQADWLLPDPVLESQVLREPARDQWCVFAKISMKALGLEPLRPGAGWTFSFCRYDYDQGNPDPVHSSCSQLNKLDFHDQDCWDELVIV